jgi:hypothetical protein
MTYLITNKAHLSEILKNFKEKVSHGVEVVDYLIKQCNFSKTAKVQKHIGKIGK